MHVNTFTKYRQKRVNSQCIWIYLSFILACIIHSLANSAVAEMEQRDSVCVGVCLLALMHCEWSALCIKLSFKLNRNKAK